MIFGSAAASLRAVKLVHTVAWAFFAGCILALPVATWRGEYRTSIALIVIVLVEVLVLALNGLRCPLTDVAARFTDDRRDDFDIYLPLWLARYNKLIFGVLYLAGVVYTAVRWFGAGR